MNSEKKILRLEIDGSWTVYEMALFLSHTRDLYNLTIFQMASAEELYHFRYLLESKRTRSLRALIGDDLLDLVYRQRIMNITSSPVDSEVLSRLANSYYPGSELQLKKVVYGSPGFTDLAGIGDVIGHLKEFLLRIIEHFSNSEQRRLENDERELRNQRLLIENTREFVRFLRECGYPDSDIRKMTS